MTDAVTAEQPPNQVDMDAEPVKSIRRGAVHGLTLNRPKALNAFNDQMRAIIAGEIPKIARNPDIYIVALLSESPKAFCAGGDVRALTALAKTDLQAAKDCFKDEYRLDWLLECFSKPTVSFINGVCMGSGAGLTAPNTHRVAGEAYRWAMPETGIGLFPDVGVAHLLARLPWPLGLYLGLTGQFVERADAHWLGIATHIIDAAQFEPALARLADAQPVDPLLDGLHRALPPGPLQSEAAMICDLFSGDTLTAIVKRLETATGAATSFAVKALGELKAKSPLSLVITDRHIRACRALDLRETLIQDYRLAARFLEDHDFAEGVRAALIDKDRSPRWRPESLADISEELISKYFSSLGDDELILPTRAEMQAARV